MNFIAERRRARKKLVKTRTEEDKREYYRLSRKVNEEVRKHKNECWLQFLGKIGPSHVSSMPFWKKINSYRKAKSKKRRTPTLIRTGAHIPQNERVVESEDGKARLFRDIMKTRFSNSSNQKFDNAFKTNVEIKVNEFKQRIQTDFVSVTLDELKNAILKIKSKSSPGMDVIFNIMLKHLPESFLEHILRLCNLSLETGKLPKVWKESSITMIPKGQKLASDPANYRPISLISCLSKLIERIVARRLSFYLDSNHLLIKQQSGFRTGRRTCDNLIFIAQKVSEAFNRKKKIMSLFFDIEAAFDSVWHDALVLKLLDLKVPCYIVRWVSDFLEGRTFVIKVGDTVSLPAPIAGGVPQGSSISPILFSVFINDIPVTYKENHSFSLLFADDLNTFFIYNSITADVQNEIKQYLKSMEEWLSKWRMNMAPSKCQYTIFAKCNREKKVFDVKLFGEAIPYEANPTSLGVTFNPTLSFEAQVKKIKDKCNDRLNILKIISHKSWALSKDTLVAIYKSLIGSVIDYSAFMSSQLSDNLRKSVQAIQNIAMRIIFKQPFDASTDSLSALSGLPLVRDRMYELNRRYFEAARTVPNELIVDLMTSFKNFKMSFKAKTKTLKGIDKTVLCDFVF